MPLILHIETATDICSVCLAKNGKVLAVKENKERNTHASVITLLIEELFIESGHLKKELNAVAISSGPGSYTGLRIGTSIAKGICYALNIPLIEIPTLQAIANGGKKQIPDAPYYCPMLDARRNEVYTALYDSDLKEIIPVTPLIIDKPEVLTHFATDSASVFLGNGADKFAEMMKSEQLNLIAGYGHSSIDMVSISLNKYINKNFQDIAYFEPVYLKLFDKVINRSAG